MGIENVSINSKGFPDISRNPLPTGYFQSVSILSDMGIKSSSKKCAKTKSIQDAVLLKLCNVRHFGPKAKTAKRGKPKSTPSSVRLYGLPDATVRKAGRK